MWKYVNSNYDGAQIEGVAIECKNERPLRVCLPPGLPLDADDDGGMSFQAATTVTTWKTMTMTTTVDGNVTRRCVCLHSVFVKITNSKKKKMGKSEGQFLGNKICVHFSKEV